MKSQRGDTIIEVMISTAIAALIIVLAMTVMNRSFALVQMASEVTFARQAVDSQAEALRYLRNQYLDSPNKASTEWQKVINRANGAGNGGISAFGSCMTESGGTVSFPSSRSFYIDGLAKNDETTDLTNPVYTINNPTYPSSFPAAGAGVWVEVEQGGKVFGSLEPDYLDLHIRACWDPPFTTDTKATIGTIVRLYYE